MSWAPAGSSTQPGTAMTPAPPRRRCPRIRLPPASRPKANSILLRNAVRSGEGCGGSKTAVSMSRSRCPMRVRAAGQILLPAQLRRVGHDCRGSRRRSAGAAERRYGVRGRAQHVQQVGLHKAGLAPDDPRSDDLPGSAPLTKTAVPLPRVLLFWPVSGRRAMPRPSWAKLSTVRVRISLMAAR